MFFVDGGFDGYDWLLIGDWWFGIGYWWLCFWWYVDDIWFFVGGDFSLFDVVFVGCFCVMEYFI